MLTAAAVGLAAVGLTTLEFTAVGLTTGGVPCLRQVRIRHCLEKKNVWQPQVNADVDFEPSIYEKTYHREDIIIFMVGDMAYR